MSPRWKAFLDLLPIVLAAAVLTTWLSFAPPGLLGKADAVGYAVCHRIEQRSFHIGERAMPLCARCSGMYLGAFLGLVYQWRLGRRAKLPPTPIMIALGVFFVAFGIDGSNSYLHFFPNLPTLYDPTNFLRLLTGTGMGLALALVFQPVYHQSVWTEFDDRPAVETLGQFVVLLGLTGLVVLAILSENPLLLYPLALVSSATVLILLTMCYSLVWVFLLKRDNAARHFFELRTVLTLGFSTAVLQLLLMDAIRLWLMGGSWGGFQL
jgi:uncharacterized membrane protein